MSLLVLPPSNLEPIRPEVTAALEALRITGAPAFDRVQAMLPDNLTDAEKEMLSQALIDVATNFFRQGNFYDWKGFDLLAASIGIEVEFSQEFVGNLNMLLQRYDAGIVHRIVEHTGSPDSRVSGLQPIDYAISKLVPFWQNYEITFASEEERQNEVVQLLNLRQLMLAIYAAPKIPRNVLTTDGFSFESLAQLLRQEW